MAQVAPARIDHLAEDGDRIALAQGSPYRGHWARRVAGAARLATPATIRKINGPAALAALFRKGPMTRADLARNLDLTKASVTSIAAQLRAGGYLQGGEAVGAAALGHAHFLTTI